MPKTPALSACALAEMGKCLSPVQRQRVVRATTPRSSTGCARRCWRGSDAVVESVSRRMTALAAASRFEDAGSWRDRLVVVPARRRPHPAAAGAHPVPRGGGRPPRGRPAGPCTWCATAGCARPGVIPLGRPRRRSGSAELQRVGRHRARPVPARRRPPPPRRPRRSCAGWSPTGSASCTSRASGRCPVGGATKHLRLHDAVEQSRASLDPVRRPTRAAAGAPTGPLAWPP